MKGLAENNGKQSATRIAFLLLVAMVCFICSVWVWRNQDIDIAAVTAILTIAFGGKVIQKGTENKTS